MSARTRAASRPPEGTAPFTFPFSGDRVATVSIGDAWPDAVQLEIREKDGAPAFLDEKWRPGNDWHGAEVARRAHVQDSEVLAFRDQVNTWIAGLLAAAEKRDAHASPASTFALDVEAWPMDGVGASTRYQTTPESFSDFLRQGMPHSTVLKWESCAALAILDVDWHAEGKAPPVADMVRLMSELSPSPIFTHRTQRGFHAGYIALEGFTAEELASAAAAGVSRDSIVRGLSGGVEVKHTTRAWNATHGSRANPWRCPGELEDRVPDTRLRVLDELSRAECSEPEREEVLAHLGLTVGTRLSHEHCPIDAAHRSSSPNPVVVSFNGVFCYSCGARGRGFVSWGEMRRKHGLVTAESTEAAPIIDAVNHVANFRHVELLMNTLAPSFDPKWQRALYACLLKRRHGADDPRIPLALNLDWPIVRGRSLWLDRETLISFAPRPESSRFKTFSSACKIGVSKEGEKIALPSDPHLLAHAGSGRVPGYHPIVRISASPIWWIHRRHEDEGQVLYASPPKKEEHQLRYLPLRERMTFESSVVAIAERFPGIDMKYLSLLFIARGYAEGSGQQLPMLWATGESQRGKTATCNILEAMWNMVPPNLNNYDARDAKTRMEMWGLKQETGGGFVTIDDFAKGHDTKEGKEKVQAIANWLLQQSVAGRVQFKKLYVGIVEVDVVSPILLTDMVQPPAFTQNKQLGRRIIMASLENKAGNWNLNGGIVGWWYRGGMRHAAESWYSHMVDEWFGEDCKERTFQKDAEELGYRTLNEFAHTEETGLRDEYVRALFYGLCTMKPDHRFAKRGPGFWEINTNANSVAGKAMREMLLLAGEDHASERNVSEIFKEYTTGLENLLPVRCPVALQVRKNGASGLLLRFRDRTADPGVRAKFINAELLKPGTDVESLKPQE